jgi:hypothetical protein
MYQLQIRLHPSLTHRDSPTVYEKTVCELWADGMIEGEVEVVVVVCGEGKITSTFSIYVYSCSLVVTTR